MRTLPQSPGLPPRDVVLVAVDELVDRARTLGDLEDQGLQLFAARRLRSLRRPLPPRLLAQERAVAATSLVAPAVLKRVRDAYDGDLLLLKGPEAAMAYPDPALRPYGDIDVLVSDGRAAQRALITAGFRPVGDERQYRNKHHLRPLRLPTLPLTVEVHHTPHWPRGLEAPSAAELLATGGPARCGVDGIRGLPTADHAIVLAAHAWAHSPLGNLRQLLDIALVGADAGPTDWGPIAERWGASRFWAATVAAVNALFGGAPFPAAMRLWARHLASVRERTVLEAHLTSWVSPLWCLSRGPGLRAGAAELAADLRRSPGEDWHDKLTRSRLALANASENTRVHDAMLQERGLDYEESSFARAADGSGQSLSA